jgi:hypothetical protein
MIEIAGYYKIRIPSSCNQAITEGESLRLYEAHEQYPFAQAKQKYIQKNH